MKKTYLVLMNYFQFYSYDLSYRKYFILGSVRDQESIEAADKHGLTMIFTGVRHFRH